MGVKAFVIVYGILSYVDSDKIFDFDLKKCHFRFNERLNQALFPFGVQSRDIPLEFTYFVFGMIAALIQFAVVKIHVRFSHCFYIYTNLDLEDLDSQNDINGNSQSKENADVKIKMRKILKTMMFVNFLSPLLIMILFLNPFAYNYLVPAHISREAFLSQKIFFVALFCIIRMTTFREELQFQFNESFKWIKHVAQTKDERLFKYAQYRIQ